MDETRSSNAPSRSRRVGYWMTEKKLRRLNFDAFEALCRLVCHRRVLYVNDEHIHCYCNTVIDSCCCKELFYVKIHVNLCLFLSLSYVKVHGSGTFRSPVFSLLGAKVPTENIRSLERQFPGTFASGSESSREISFQGANVPGNICSAERYTGEQTVRVTSSYA